MKALSLEEAGGGGGGGVGGAAIIQRGVGESPNEMVNGGSPLIVLELFHLIENKAGSERNHIVKIL